MSVNYKNMDRIASICAEFRKEVLKVNQQYIADELGYTQENISAFENGRNANSIIFMWYIEHGLFNHYPLESVINND